MEAIYSRKEQETSINFMRDDDTVEIYTNDTTMITKLLKITKNYEVLTTDKNGRITSANFTLGIKQLSFRKVSKGTANISEEEREARRNRGNKLKEQNKGKKRCARQNVINIKK